MTAQSANALKELTALRLVDQRDQSVANFQTDFVKLEQRFNLLLVVRLFGFRNNFRRLEFTGTDLDRFAGEIESNRREEEKREFRQPGNQTEDEHDRASYP